MSELLDRDRILADAGRALNWRVSVFRETESTNDLVLRAAEGGEPEGFAVFAEAQTKGRGQFGRRWSSAFGLGLWFSILLRPRWPVAELAQMTPVVAVAAARALAETSGLDIRIKPPNDIFCNGRKLAGILSEARSGGSQVFVVVGIGINVNHAAGDFPLELQTSATSLARESGRVWTREPIAGAVLRALGGVYDPERPPGADVLAAYAALSESPLSRAPNCDSFRE
jgi:BirA family biotin operon repressor/biotin-[acetyl-CoA-carboxylase] ligase